MNRFLMFSVIIIFINIAISSWWMINGNILFHTDIARDFLLVEDIFNNKNLALIGPRSGAVPGVFHGPLWLYINVPAFIIGNGNPVVVGWFWVLLSISALIITYYITNKLFGTRIALLSTILLSLIQSMSIKSLFNPYGALMLSPLYVYLLVKYLHSLRIITLLAAVLVLGLIIQFQMAFGIPVLILSLVYLTVHSYRKKKLVHLCLFPVIALPLSTFIVFDLRNNFLQIRSVLNFLQGIENHGKINQSFVQLALMRLKESLLDGFSLVSTGSLWLLVPLVLVIIYAAFKFKGTKATPARDFYLLSLYFYFGFWVIALLFKGPVWTYYFWPFLPLLVIAFCSVKQYVSKYIFYAFYILIFLVNFQNSIKETLTYDLNYLNHGESSWLFNYHLAKSVFKDAGGDFGYYIFTPDLYGYYPRYSLNYVQKEFPQAKAYPYQKKPLTYLIIAPPPYYGKDPNSLWYQKNINSTSWKNSDIKISKLSDNVAKYPNGFQVERYNLTSEDIKVPSNPYLIHDLIFR